MASPPARRRRDTSKISMARHLTAMPSSMIGTMVWSRYVRIGRFQTAESRAAAPGGSAAGGPGAGAGSAGLGLGAGGATGAGGAAGGAAGAAVAGGASMALESTGLVWEQAELTDAAGAILGKR